MDLLKTLSGQRESKEFEFGKKKIVLQTLTQEEQTEIFAKTANFTNMLHMATAQKVLALARSLVSIDNIPIENFDEAQEKIKEEQKNNNNKVVDIISIKESVLSKLSTTVIDVLYSKFIALKEEHTKKIEDILKN